MMIFQHETMIFQHDSTVTQLDSALLLLVVCFFVFFCLEETVTETPSARSN